MGMTNEPQAANCPNCGTTLPNSIAHGLCPRCLFAGLAEPTVDLHSSAPAAVPNLEDLSPHFPQLELIGLLGRGGMGIVYQARQKSLNRMVALKLLSPERVHDAAFAQRFANEAQALAKLNHPNIVTIHDFGQAGGYYFLLMEYVDGVNLRQAMKAGKFTPEQALAVVPPVCEALQYAHEQGIVHRDIKPENLLLDKSGKLKIADFGIAKLIGAPLETHAEGNDGSAGLTQGSALGTPNYSAPEQKCSPTQVDHRADIYSLGVVLYELLTGELPGAKLQAPSRKVQVDVRLDEIVLRALETKPELRFATAQEFRTQVETVIQPIAVTPPEPLSEADTNIHWDAHCTTLIGSLVLLGPLLWLVMNHFLPRMEAAFTLSKNAAAFWLTLGCVGLWSLGLRILWKRFPIANHEPDSRRAHRFHLIPVAARKRLLTVLVIFGLAGTVVFCGFGRSLQRTTQQNINQQPVPATLDQWRYGLAPAHEPHLAGPWLVTNQVYGSQPKVFQELQLASTSFLFGVWTLVVWGIVLTGLAAEVNAKIDPSSRVFWWEAYRFKDGRWKLAWKRVAGPIVVAMALFLVVQSFLIMAMDAGLGDSPKPLLLYAMMTPMIVGPMIALLRKSSHLPIRSMTAEERTRVFVRLGWVFGITALVLIMVLSWKDDVRAVPGPATAFVKQAPPQLMPFPVQPGFGPEQGRFISAEVADIDGCVFFSFTGNETTHKAKRLKLSPAQLPFAEITPELEVFIKQRKLDFLLQLTEPDLRIMTLGMEEDYIAQPNDWHQVTADQAREVFRKKDRQGLVAGRTSFIRDYVSTWSSVQAFRTQEGRVGIYQYHGMKIPHANQKGLNLRWKFVQD
jgi:serine/threonine protein kinase